MVDKVAVVTAGGSGMGAAAARRLAQDGFKIAVLSSSGKGEALAQELGGLGVTGSNQSNDDLKRLVDGALARWGRIDVLVNSAGHGPRAPVLDLTDEPDAARVVEPPRRPGHVGRGHARLAVLAGPVAVPGSVAAHDLWRPHHLAASRRTRECVRFPYGLWTDIQVRGRCSLRTRAFSMCADGADVCPHRERGSGAEARLSACVP